MINFVSRFQLSRIAATHHIIYAYKYFRKGNLIAKNFHRIETFEVILKKVTNIK